MLPESPDIELMAVLNQIELVGCNAPLKEERTVCYLDDGAQIVRTLFLDQPFCTIATVFNLKSSIARLNASSSKRSASSSISSTSESSKPS